LIVNFKKGSTAPVTWKLNGSGYYLHDDSIEISTANSSLIHINKPTLIEKYNLITWARDRTTPKFVFFYNVKVYDGSGQVCGLVDPLIISHG
jgi:hypothetical protein